jgi:transcriptional regulator with AAA-type ATPase domain
MNREQQILDTLNEITKKSNLSKKEKTNQENLYEILQGMDETEMQNAKKLILHMIEKNEGNKQKIKEAYKINKETEEQRLNSMFTNLL